MKDISPGQFIYVPCNCAKEFDTCNEALVRAEVLNVEGAYLKVNVGGGNESGQIEVAKVHTNPSILILCLGDIVSELQNLDPLAKSILHYCRLLHKDPEQVKYYKTRSLDDLKDLWTEYGITSKIIIFISHGCYDGFTFGRHHNCLAAKELTEIFKTDRDDNKLFLSLSCQTGSGEFGAQISKTNFCKDFIGPETNIHSALASQFCQTFLANYLMNGSDIVESFKKAKEAIPGTMTFNLFLEGEKYVQQLHPTAKPIYEYQSCSQCGCLGQIDRSANGLGTVVACNNCGEYFCFSCLEGNNTCTRCLKGAT